MKVLPKIALFASMFVMVMAILLSYMDKNFISGPNGWLDLAQMFAILAIALKYVYSNKEYM